MRVDGDCRQPLGGRYVAQVAAEALLVDREIVVERQQHGRNDAVRDVMGVTGHRKAPCGQGRSRLAPWAKSACRLIACAAGGSPMGRGAGLPCGLPRVERTLPRYKNRT